MRRRLNTTGVSTIALIVGILSILLFMMACGGTETPAETAPAAPAPAAAAPAPAAVSGVSEAAVTILIARGIDVMDPAAGTEANHHYIRPLFGYLVAGGGGDMIEPGIATNWEMDSDGLGRVVK